MRLLRKLLNLCLSVRKGTTVLPGLHQLKTEVPDQFLWRSDSVVCLRCKNGSVTRPLALRTSQYPVWRRGSPALPVHYLRKENGFRTPTLVLRVRLLMIGLLDALMVLQLVLAMTVLF